MLAQNSRCLTTSAGGRTVAPRGPRAKSLAGRHSLGIKHPGISHCVESSFLLGNISVGDYRNIWILQDVFGRSSTWPKASPVWRLVPPERWVGSKTAMLRFYLLWVCQRFPSRLREMTHSNQGARSRQRVGMCTGIYIERRRVHSACLFCFTIPRYLCICCVQRNQFSLKRGKTT